MDPDGNRPVPDGHTSPEVDAALHLDCECGDRTLVTMAEAGVRLTCSCGRILQVPNLHELRMRAGLPPFPVPTATHVEGLVKAGDLPVGTTCARCSEPAVAVLHAMAACEFLWTTTEEWSISGIVVSDREVSQHGHDLVVPVPLRLCPDCQRAIFHPSWIERLSLAAIPLAVLGVVSMVFALWPGGIVLLAIAGLLYLAPDWTRRKRQQDLKGLLRRTPLYDQLLAEYPDAVVYVAQG